jgi:hypothetical protein
VGVAGRLERGGHTLQAGRLRIKGRNSFSHGSPMVAAAAPARWCSGFQARLFSRATAVRELGLRPRKSLM